MAKVDFEIMIEKKYRIPGIDGFPIVDTLGLVSTEAGRYPIQPQLEVQVCKSIRRYNRANLQKLILRESGQRRRIAMIHHNASGPVIQDLNPMASLAFTIRQR